MASPGGEGDDNDEEQYSAAFKARVAVEAIRGEKTLSQLGSQFKVHPIQTAKWRKSALDQMPELFVDGRTKKNEWRRPGTTFFMKRSVG